MAKSLDGVCFGERLRVEPWSDSLVEAHGHDPRSDYAERFWLPILGPSTLWLLRLLAQRLEAEPHGYDIDITETARRLGLGERAGRNAPFQRTVARAIDFEMAVLRGSGLLGVRRSLPGLPRRHLLRLPPSLRAEHDELSGEAAFVSIQRRCQRLALSLLALGESAPDVEQQLLRWRFHPALASRAIELAQANLATTTTASIATLVGPAQRSRTDDDRAPNASQV